VLTRACATNIENPVDITHEGTCGVEEGRGGGEKKTEKTTTVFRDGSVGELIKSVLWLFKCHVVSAW
jgi:hypothetical protein